MCLLPRLRRGSFVDRVVEWFTTDTVRFVCVLLKDVSFRMRLLWFEIANPARDALALANEIHLH